MGDIGTVLITGAGEGAEQVAAEVAAAGASPLVLGPDAADDAALADIEDGSIQRYIQLPVAVDVGGGSVVHRVRAFLQDGLMARFSLAEAILPKLDGTGTVLLVSGNTLVEGNTPDDSDARRSMLHVLAHAMRADKAPDLLRVRVVDRSVGAERMARAVVSGESLEPRAAAPEGDITYVEWRTQILGMVGSEF